MTKMSYSIYRALEHFDFEQLGQTELNHTRVGKGGWGWTSFNNTSAISTKWYCWNESAATSIAGLSGYEHLKNLRVLFFDSPF
jgi:hypothetical protein